VQTYCRYKVSHSDKDIERNGEEMSEIIPLNTILILSGNPAHLNRDRNALFKFKQARILSFSSGQAAMDFMSKKPVIDLILCDAKLEDMSGISFLQNARGQESYKSTPIVMVTLDNHKNAVLDSVSAGCSGYILRPYSQETFERHVLFALQMERFSEIENHQLEIGKELVTMGDFDDAIEEFEEIVSMQNEAQKYFDLGTKYLINYKFGKAIIAFNKAIKINKLFAEAYKGLADAWKGKGDENRYKEFLQRAAEVYAELNRFDETRELFVEILKSDSEAPNPYNTLGVKLRRKSDYNGAIHAYNMAIELTPEDENIYYNVAKAYMYVGDKDKALQYLNNALDLNDDFPEALKLYSTIKGEKYVSKGPARPRAEARPHAAESLKDI